MARWRKRKEGDEEPLGSSIPDASTEFEAGDTDAVEIWNDDRGMLVSGQPGAVEALVRRLTTPEPGQPATLVPTDAADALAVFSAGLADGATTAPTAAQYFQHTPRSLALLAEHGTIPTENGAFRSFVHNGTGFAGNLDWQPADLGSQRALVMQTTAIGMALRLAVKEVNDAVARVEGQVDRLVSMFRSERLGDAVGDHRTLEAMVDKVRRGDGLSTTDWSAVAFLGPIISRDIEALRANIRLNAGTAVSGERTRARAQAGNGLIGEGLLAESLATLLVAEHNFTLWQELRLEQIRSNEPEHLEASLHDARSAIAQQTLEDQALLDQLHAVGAELFHPRVRDGLAPLQTRRLEDGERDLRLLLRQFAEQRTLDLADAGRSDRPNALDSIRHAAGTSARVSASTGRQVLSIGSSVVGRGKREAGSKAERSSQPASEVGSSEPIE